MRALVLGVLAGAWFAACDNGLTATVPDASSVDVLLDGPAADAAADGAAPDLSSDGPEPDAATDGPVPDAPFDGPEPDQALDAPPPDLATDGALPDAEPDAVVLPPDVGPDLALDVALDLGPLGPDATLDLGPDVALDVGPDAAPDADPDTAPDGPVTDADPDAAPDGPVADAGPPRTWFVAAGAEDPGTGDEATPFPTINAALEPARAGDTVLVAPGEYVEHVEVELADLQIGAEAGARLVGNGEDPALEMRAPGVVVTGLAVDGAGARMAVRLDDCDGCALVDCEVAHARGVDGEPGRSGRSARAVFISGGAAVRIEGCSISDVRAGAGGDAAEEGERGRAGSLAAGINAQDTTDLLVRGNTLTGALGGLGGAGDPPGTAGNSEQILLSAGVRSAVVSNTVHDLDAPGRGVGICILQSEATTSAFNHVHHLHAVGAASGLLLLFTEDHAATNELVHDISGGTAGGVRVDSGSAIRVDHVTVRGVAPDEEGDDAAAVLLDGGDVVVRNSILAGAPAGMWSDEGNDPEDARLAFSMTFELGGDVLVNATDGGDNVSAEPGFVDPVANADLRLNVDSPAVDAADPEAPCDQEPPPAEGPCRADLGHTGNTPSAHAR